MELPYDPEALLPDIYPRETKAYIHRNTYTNIYSTIIYNGQEVETIQMSLNWWMD